MIMFDLKATPICVILLNFQEKICFIKLLKICKHTKILHVEMSCLMYFYMLFT